MTGDPTLIVAVRQLLKAQQRARAAGVALAPEDQDAFIRAETHGKYTLKDAQSLLASIDTSIGARNLGRSFVQGATMNFGDELLGVLPEWLGGGKAAEEEMRLRDDLFREQHPVASTSAGVGGAVLAGLLAPEVELGEAAGVGGLALRGAVTGGVIGGLSGAGRGETASERLKDAAIDATAGGVTGAALPVLARGVQLFTAPEVRAAQRVLRAVNKSGGPSVVLRAARDATRLGRGDVTMLGDLSPQLRAATDFAANNSEDVYTELAPKLYGRQADMSDRLLQDVTDAVGDQDASARAAELAKARREFAEGPNGYGGLREAYPQLADGVVPMDGKVIPMTSAAQPLADILNQPKIASALREAQETGLIGKTPDTGLPSFQKLQDIKERLDDAVTAAYRQGKGNLAHRLGEARDALVEEMQKRVPGYADVAAEYARRMRLERALEAGAEAWNQVDTRGLRRTVQSLSPDELAEFRRGMASALITKLRSAQTNRNVAQELVNASKSMQDKLEIVFGSKQVFDEFMERVRLEAQLAQQLKSVGGSQTWRRAQAAAFDPEELAADVLPGVPYGPAAMASWLGRVGARVGRGALARRSAAQLGPLLTTTGPDAIEQLLMSIQGQAALTNPFATKALPAAAGGLFGQF